MSGGTILGLASASKSPTTVKGRLNAPLLTVTRGHRALEQFHVSVVTIGRAIGVGYPVPDPTISIDSTFLGTFDVAVTRLRESRKALDDAFSDLAGLVVRDPSARFRMRPAYHGEAVYDSAVHALRAILREQAAKTITAGKVRTFLRHVAPGGRVDVTRIRKDRDADVLGAFRDRVPYQLDQLRNGIFEDVRRARKRWRALGQGHDTADGSRAAPWEVRDGALVRHGPLLALADVAFRLLEVLVVASPDPVPDGEVFDHVWPDDADMRHRLLFRLRDAIRSLKTDIERLPSPWCEAAIPRKGSGGYSILIEARHLRRD